MVPGIPDDIIDSIFFPLVSSKEIASGLGLSIVKGIINQHHGSIDCSSDETGTTFTILLPISEINFEKKSKRRDKWLKIKKSGLLMMMNQ